MNFALLCLSALLALAWLPVLFQFFRNWRSRNNPISLAICFVVAFAVYLCLQPFIGLIGKETSPEITALAVQAANTATCVFFHISFGWAKKKFGPEDRQVVKTRSGSTDYPAAIESDRIS